MMSYSSQVCPQILITPPTEDNQKLYLCEPTTNLSSNNLLIPCHFDWADEVEQSINNAQSSVIQDPQRYQPVWPTSDAQRRRDKFSVQSSLGSINEEVCEPTIEWIKEPINLASSLFESEPQISPPRSHASSPAFLEPPVHEEKHFKVSPPRDKIELLDKAQENVNKIFQARGAWMEIHPQIHHFSWTGHHVFDHSATQPSDSLAIIMATPKNANVPGKLRMKAAVNCAFQWVDPVIILLDDSVDELMQLRGSKLAQASKGRVYKFYSPHGGWTEDPRDSSDDAIADFGRLGTYEARCFEIGNGFVESSAIRTLGQWVNEIPIAPEQNGWSRKRNFIPRLSPLSQCESAPLLGPPAIRALRQDAPVMPASIEGLPRRRTWNSQASSLNKCETAPVLEPRVMQTLRYEPLTASNRMQELPRKRRWSPQPSPVSQSESAPVAKAQRGVKSASPNQARRRTPRKITTCIKEKVPHVYSSFPEPRLGKSRLKAFKKATKALFYDLKDRFMS